MRLVQAKRVAVVTTIAASRHNFLQSEPACVLKKQARLSTTITHEKCVLQSISNARNFLILCEYTRQRRQRGVKRCEWVSGLDFRAISKVRQNLLGKTFTTYDRSLADCPLRTHQK